MPMIQLAYHGQYNMHNQVKNNNFRSNNSTYNRLYIHHSNSQNHEVSRFSNSNRLTQDYDVQKRNIKRTRQLSVIEKRHQKAIDYCTRNKNRLNDHNFKLQGFCNQLFNHVKYGTPFEHYIPLNYFPSSKGKVTQGARYKKIVDYCHKRKHRLDDLSFKNRELCNAVNEHLEYGIHLDHFVPQQLR